MNQKHGQQVQRIEPWTTRDVVWRAPRNDRLLVLVELARIYSFSNAERPVDKCVVLCILELNGCAAYFVRAAVGIASKGVERLQGGRQLSACLTRWQTPLHQQISEFLECLCEPRW